MSLRRITANISKMDILLALAAGVVMFSYFIPTVEAYNPKEQQETSKRPASQQLESRRGGHMLGDYPRQSQPPITDRAIGPLADVKKEEDVENKVGNDLEAQSLCDIPREEERILAPEAGLAAGSLMLRRIRDRTLLEQLGVGSCARYGPRAPRQRPRRPALPPSTLHHGPLFLYNYDSRIPPTAISSLNEQELLKTVPSHGGLVPSDPQPAAIAAHNPPKLEEAGDPPLETPSYGAIVSYFSPSACNLLTKDNIHNRIRANQFPQRQFMNPRPHQEPNTSHVNFINPITQYLPGQLGVPRFLENPHDGYNDRLGLAFHPPLVIGFNRNSRTGREHARIPPQAIDYRGSGGPSLVIPNDSIPTPPSSFEASAWERHSSTRTKTNSPGTTSRNFEASVWESYSSTRRRVNVNTIAFSRATSDPVIRELRNQETLAQTNHLALAKACQSDPNASSRSRDYVVPRDLAALLGLPSADQDDDGSSSESSNPGLPRSIASFLGLPSADKGGGDSSSPEATKPSLPRAIPSSPSVQGDFDRPPPYELSATSSGLLYLPADPPQKTSGIVHSELTGADYVSVPQHHTRRAAQTLPDNEPPASLRNDKLLAQLQQFATGNAIIEGARGTSPSGIPRLAPIIDPVHGGTRTTVADIVRTRPGKEVFQPKPGNPLRRKELRDHNYREIPETEGDGAMGHSLRGGEAPDYMAMVPLRPRGRSIANTFDHAHASALSTENPKNREEELVATEHSMASLVPPPHQDPTQEIVKRVENSHGEIDFEWKFTEPTYEFSAGSAMTINSQRTSSPIPSTASALYSPGDVSDAGASGLDQAISTSSFPSRERRILLPPALGSSGLPTPPPSWRLPSHHSPSRIPVPCGGETYHGHLSPQRRAGLSSIMPPSPTKPSTRLPTAPKIPPLISVPTIRKLHQPSLHEAPSNPIHVEDSPFGEMAFSLEIDEVEPGPTKSLSLPSFNRPKKPRKRLTEESLRVWMLRQCYLAKLNAAYEEVVHKEEEVDREGLMDLEVFMEDGGSFI